MSPERARQGVKKSRRLTRELWRGITLAGAGARTWSTSRRLMAWGLVPGAVTLVIFGVAAVVIATQVWGWAGSIAGAVADPAGWVHGLIQVVAALAIVVGAVVLGIYTFTAVTLLLGQVFFERISRAVDEAHGFTGVDPEEPWHRSLSRSVGEMLRLAVLTIPLAIGLFVVGLVPVVGAVVSFVLAAAFGGWFLALELTSYPLERRGVIRLAERRAVLRRSRATVVGFGAAVFLLFLIPLGPALFMPAAVAGATRLVQDSAGTSPKNT